MGYEIVMSVGYARRKNSLYNISLVLEIQYNARPLRHFQWDLVSKHLYDLVILSIFAL